MPYNIGLQFDLADTNLTTSFQYSARAPSASTPSLSTFFNVGLFAPETAAITLFIEGIVAGASPVTTMQVQVRVSFDGTNAFTVIIGTSLDNVSPNVSNMLLPTSGTITAGTTVRTTYGSTNVRACPYIQIGGRAQGGTPIAGDRLRVWAVLS